MGYKVGQTKLKLRFLTQLRPFQINSQFENDCYLFSSTGQYRLSNLITDTLLSLVTCLLVLMTCKNIIMNNRNTCGDQTDICKVSVFTISIFTVPSG